MPMMQGAQAVQGPPQGVPQEGPQGVPQGQPQVQGGSSFPKGDAEGEQFILQLVKVIHGDKEIPRVLEENIGGKAPSSAIVGAIAAQLLTLLFTKLYEQTQGKRVSRQFAVEIIRVAVKEIVAIAESIGPELSVKEEKEAATVAGDSLDQSMQELYSQGGQAQGQPQGPPQEVPQGPPQQVAPQGIMQGGM